ncbi:MAG: exo-alpha-sialidase [Ruminococcaceae bacterium]|nr:exo-alpha-sialidase [Oscillospiraceae bacterium]
MKKIFTKILALSLLGALVITTLASCKDSEQLTPAEDIPNANEYSLDGFTLVVEEGAEANTKAALSTLKSTISNKLGIDLPVVNDGTEALEKEILVGETNRSESSSTVSYLKKQNKDQNSFAVRVSENKIVITGTDDLSTARAIWVFIESYVYPSSAQGVIDISCGNQQLGLYDESSLILASNGTAFHVDSTTLITQPNVKYTTADGNEFIVQNASYPSITELKYQPNPADNGKLIATAATLVYDLTENNPTYGCVMMSSDKGKTWKALARPKETLHDKLPRIGTMAHIYELPTKVGDMPAGTLLYSYCSVDYNDKSDGMLGKSILAVWRSFDCGVSWEEYVIIDEAKGIKEGVWEPFMTYCEEDGYLYCFYSDDSDPGHDQKVVYKRSKDGVNWEGKDGMVASTAGASTVEPIEVVAVNSFAFRPGMPVITKMGNGEYFMVYEQEGDKNSSWTDFRIFYKKTTNLADWGDPSDRGTIIPESGKYITAGSPSCAWLDIGGEKGVLIVTSKRSSNKGVIFISFDYGETWETIEDPLAGTPISKDQDRVGYSAGLWVGDDGKTLYYANTVDRYGERYVAFAKITIYSPMDIK